MNLQNGYKVIYEKTADGTRTFYATKNTKCDPTVDDKIIEAFAQINHSTVEEVKQNIENEVYSIEQLKDSLIDNAAATKSLEIVNGKVAEFNNISTGDKTIDGIIKNIVASAGSESSYNTLEESQREALLKEKEGANGFKISLRSHETINVSDIALLLGGGGHRGAAGCFVPGTVEYAKTKIIDAIKHELNK